jgi:hypothetical protein
VIGDRYERSVALIELDSKSEVRDFGPDEDGDPITVNVVSSEEVEPERLRRSGRWPKGLRLVRDVAAAAILEADLSHQVGGNGPTVKAAPVELARDIHGQRYVSTGEGDRAEAERKAWRRNFRAAQDANLIAGELTGGQQLIWLVQQ